MYKYSLVFWFWIQLNEFFLGAGIFISLSKYETKLNPCAKNSK